VLVAGELLVVPPITAWAQVSQYIDEEELVVLGDSMMRRNPLLKKATLHEFEDYLAQTLCFKGKQNCERALKYMTENTDSSQETRLRYALQKEGFAAPVANYRVVVPGTPLSYLIDMAWPSSKVGIEYDGAYHLDAHQQSLDAERQRDLEALGWQIIHVSVGQLSDDSRIQALVAQVISAFACNELV
jgi:very-short-patch-repair endonuclease